MDQWQNQNDRFCFHHSTWPRALQTLWLGIHSSWLKHLSIFLIKLLCSYLCSYFLSTNIVKASDTVVFRNQMFPIKASKWRPQFCTNGFLVSWVLESGTILTATEFLAPLGNFSDFQLFAFSYIIYFFEVFQQLQSRSQMPALNALSPGLFFTFHVFSSVKLAWRQGGFYIRTLHLQFPTTSGCSVRLV